MYDQFLFFVTQGLPHDQYYIIHNGRLIYENAVCLNGHATIVPRLLGGKGGFGSMLRAIGAQIEKTTNREACRDLSGRRLRDINEEKRLKAWIEKQAKREEETAERKKKKLEKLCAEPRHEFKDQRYEQERADLTERIGDAVEEGFKAASTSGVKRKLEEDVKPNKRKTILDLDIDSDELEDMSDNSDNNEDNNVAKLLPAEESNLEQQASNDSGHSSDDSERVSETIEKAESERTESSLDNQTIDETLSDAPAPNTKCAENSTKN